MQTQTRQLNRQDYKTLSLSALGGALEFYDFIVYAFFANIISTLFFPPDMPEWLRLLQTFGIFAAGYLSRPFGGVIMAHFGDLVGRKRMFSLSILLMAIPTLAIGLLPTYETIGVMAPILLLMMRMMQGAAIGGEVPGAWVFVAEHVPSNRVGLACGILTAGLTFGILIGSLVHMAVALMPTESLVSYGWRIPFILGGLFGFLTMYLRRWLKETPIFLEMQAHKKLAPQLPLKSILLSHKQSVVISMLLTWVLSAGILVVIIMAPSYLESVLGYNKMTSSVANGVAIVCLTFGCIAFGSLIERLGAFRTLVGGCLYCIVSVTIFYYCANYSPEYLIPSYAAAGFGVGIIGAFPYVMVKLFPAQIRFSGVSLSFNLAYAITAAFTAPLVITMTQFVSLMAPALYVGSLFVLAIVIGFIVRTHPRLNENQVTAEEQPLVLAAIE